MKVCLFDIDGTLLASGGAGKAALEAALTDDFGTPIRENIPYSGRTDRAIIRDLFQSHDIEHSQANIDRIFRGYLQRLPESLRQHRGHVLPGIQKLIAELRRRQVHIGLLTGNVRAGAQVKLGHFDLYHEFAFGGFGDHHFDRDEVAREAREEVRRNVGDHIEPDSIWVIGDTPLDVQCARAIGARVAAVATGVHTLDQLREAKPDLLYTDLSTPADLLAHIR